MDFREGLEKFQKAYFTWCDTSDAINLMPMMGEDSKLTIRQRADEIDDLFSGLMNEGELTVFRLFRVTALVQQWYAVKCGRHPRTLFEICELLLAKNHDYGNSALVSPSLLPSLTPYEAILVRLSDKRLRLHNLSRGMADSVGESLEDTLVDIMGYLILLWIAQVDEHEAVH